MSVLDPSQKRVLASVIVQGERQNSFLGPPVTPAAVSLIETVADRNPQLCCLSVALETVRSPDSNSGIPQRYIPL